MAPVQIPCPYAPDCLWQSIPLDFDKALILVEQHVRFKHPEAAEQSAKGEAKIYINFNTNDVSSFVKTELRETEGNVRIEQSQAAKTNIPFDVEDDEYVETVKVKRKRGRPPKKTTKEVSDSDSDKYEYNSEDSDDIEDYDIFDDDDNDDLDDDDGETDRKKKRGRKRKFQEEEDDESPGYDDLDSSDEKEQILLQEHRLKLRQVGVLTDQQVLSGADDEEMERHITSYEEEGVTYRRCNYCGYTTDRQDKLTLPEHLFTHFPDICGCACPVCRKPEKRKSLLLKHMEDCHTKEVLIIMGVTDIRVYDQMFSSFSEEQKALRKEEYIRSKCQDCKGVFWSRERRELHRNLGFCNAEMIASIRADRREKYEEKYGNKYQERKHGIFRERKRRLPKQSSQKERKQRPRKMCQQYNGEGAKPYLKDGENISDGEDEKEFMPRKKNGKIIPPKLKTNFKGGFELGSGGGKGLQYEQVSIDENYPGLMECLNGGRPYLCVVPTCNQRPYPNMGSMRQHYVRHDPEMWGFLVCPICQFKAYDDHPGDMKKHIMFEHNKPEKWAKDNMIFDVSEKLKRFRKLTTKEVIRLDGRKVNTFEGVEKLPINLTDPAIRASFSGSSPTYLICGVAGCEKLCESVYKLKIHYERHDVSLQRERFECNLCSYIEDRIKRMRKHIEKDHPEVLFLMEAGEDQWRAVKSEKWKRFSDDVDAIVEAEGGKRRHEEEQEEFETVHMQCSYCVQTFNTRVAYVDHQKVHQTHLIQYTCEKCREGFIVEKVYLSHIRGHRSPYTSTKMGSFRCNGCCQYFKKLTEVKKHLQMQHYNLLDACMFCDHCSEMFVNRQSLEKHMFVHVEEVFQCHNCKKKFLTQRELEAHTNKIQKCKPKSKLKKYHYCPFGCGDSFVSAQLWKHKKKCKNAPEFKVSVTLPETATAQVVATAQAVAFGAQRLT